MIIKNIISFAMMSFIGKALAGCNFATKDGYSCCRGCNVVLTDSSGKWGVENNDWCGIDDSFCNSQAATSCWSLAEGYRCCSNNTPVVLTDSKGKWGIENNEWCGIVNQPQNASSCWAAAEGYKCCNGCEPIYTDGNRSWGVENGQWCGILLSKCNAQKPTQPKPQQTTQPKPQPTSVATNPNPSGNASNTGNTSSNTGNTNNTNNTNNTGNTGNTANTGSNTANTGSNTANTGSNTGGSGSQSRPGWTDGNDQVLPGFLSTQGHYIVDSKGNKVKLAGLSWFGGETTNLSPHGLWAQPLEKFIQLIKDHGYNHLRYPWTNEMFFEGAKTESINAQENPDLVNLTPLEVMDAVINACGKAGLKVYLDRHRPLSGGQSELWYVPEVSEEKWIEDWKFLAKRYKGNPTVIGADLHNEPHGTACWGCGEENRDWRLAAERCGNAIHEVNPDWLIIVEGNDHYGEEGWQKGESYWWGGMLKGVKENPVRLKVQNKLVYSAHDYDKNVHLQDWFKEADFPNNMPKIWDDKWGFIAKEDIAPVLIGEFGSLLKDKTDVNWLENLIKYMNDNQVHWTFWCLNPNSGDTEGILGNDWMTVNSQKDGILDPGKAPNFLLKG